MDIVNAVIGRRIGRETNVVELDLIEAALNRLASQSRVVLPCCRLERIDPGQALAVDPHAARPAILDSDVQASLRSIAGKHVVLEDDNTPNHVGTTLMQRL